MNTTSFIGELLQLPDQVYQARCSALQAEQHLLEANRQYEQLRTHYYLTACASGDGHYKASGVATAAPDVAAARRDSGST